MASRREWSRGALRHQGAGTLKHGEGSEGFQHSQETLEVFNSIFHNLNKKPEPSPLRDAQKREERQWPGVSVTIQTGYREKNA